VVSVLPLPARLLSPPFLLGAPDGAQLADAGGLLVGLPGVHVPRMLSAGRAARTRGF
jgi:hypothetical protein